MSLIIGGGGLLGVEHDHVLHHMAAIPADEAGGLRASFPVPRKWRAGLEAASRYLLGWLPEGQGKKLSDATFASFICPLPTDEIGALA